MPLESVVHNEDQRATGMAGVLPLSGARKLKRLMVLPDCVDFVAT
jgi:hypothetical protein